MDLLYMAEWKPIKVKNMAGFAIPAMVSAIGGLVGAGLNERAAYRANERAFAQTKELFGMQQADRDEQNRWNSPAHMVSMLKAAGLSPASFYGGAAQSAGSAGVATPSNAEVTTPDLGTPITSGANAATNALISSEQLEINKDLAKSQIDLNAANALKSMYSGHLDAWDLNQRKRMQQDLDQKIRNDVIKGSAEIRKIDKEVERLAFDLDFDKEVREFNVEYERQKTEKEKWTAFAQKWNGMVSQYQRRYMDKHGRQVPSDMISGLVEWFEERTHLDSPIGGAIKRIKEALSRKDKDDKIVDKDGKIKEFDWDTIKELYPE